MRRFTDGALALEDFRESGGAMNYDAGIWFVGTAEEIAEMVSPNTARAATRIALFRTGAPPAEVLELMANWIEPKGAIDA